MDFDLAIGIAMISGLSISAYGVGRRIGVQRGYSHPIYFALSLMIAVGFAWLFSGKLAWASILPLASVVFWSNLLPVLLSFTAGLASTAQGLDRWHRGATIAALAILTAAYTLTPVMRPIFAPAITSSQSKWSGTVCLQSHPATCAPAAAATLLQLSGIVADEASLVDTCLTSRYGTEPLSLFRGLSIASQNHRRRPQVASSNPELWEQENQLPNIALVQFEQSGRTGSLHRLLGPQGEGHAVVILGRNHQGRWIVADPAFGKTTWSEQEFRSRFTGDAIYMSGGSD